MNYLTANELADLVGCKPNQRSKMAAWLDKNHWRYVLDKSGLPKVACAYHERKMGISDSKDKPLGKYGDSPNLQAFSSC